MAICPGGEVEVCVGVCPGTTARVYGACVQVQKSKTETETYSSVMRLSNYIVRAALTGVLKQRDSEGRGLSCFNSVDFFNESFLFTK